MAVLDIGSLSSITTTGGCLLLCYGISLAVYRLYFHELSKFPGPKLAALTWWYDYYYDVHLNGQFVFQIEKLHESYVLQTVIRLYIKLSKRTVALTVVGPIIRITPDELHVSDPDFFTEFMAKQGSQAKDARTANKFNNAMSSFSAISAEDHKLKRSAIEPMFTRSSVRQLLPLLQQNTAKLVSRLSDYVGSAKSVRLDRLFFALSEDMIFEYGFGISKNALDKENMDDILHEVFVKGSSVTALSVHFPLIPALINRSPDWLIAALAPDFLPIIKLKQSFLAEYNALANPEKEKSIKPKTHRTVMLDIFNNPNLPASLKTEQYLMDESQVIIGAGLSTSGWAATVGIYHILSQPDVLKRIRDELLTVVPNGIKRRDCTDLDWAALEALPYFQACIKETLRLSYGMSARSTRVTNKVIMYSPSTQYTTGVKGSKFPKSWQIPANCPVSVSIPIVNHNEYVFPDSHKFDPERWLGPNKVPDKYFVTFSKGARQCLGMQLAWAELSLMLGSVIRWFDMELYETDVRAVKMRYDNTIPIPETKEGVRVKVKAGVE